MEKKEFKEAIAKVRKNSPKRKFKQSFDLIINLKDINLKDSTQQVDLFVGLPYPRGKETKICAIVGAELVQQAKEACNTVITEEDFEKYARNKKLIKKAAVEHQFFIAQANQMTEIAKTFGRVLGPKGKMPNPKAGCVVPPNANLKPLCERLRTTIRVAAKTQPSIKCMIGNEEMKDEEILENVMAVYTQVVRHLPNEDNNIKSILLKLTMGQNVKVGGKEEKQAPEKKEADENKPAAEKAKGKEAKE